MWITPNTKIYQTTLVFFWFATIANTKTLTENYSAQFKELESSTVIDYTNAFLTDSIDLCLHGHCFLLAREVMVVKHSFPCIFLDLSVDKPNCPSIQKAAWRNIFHYYCNKWRKEAEIYKRSHWGRHAQNGEKQHARVLLKTEESMAEKVENTCFLGLGHYQSIIL